MNNQCLTDMQGGAIVSLVGKRETFTDQIRRAIDASDLPRRQICLRIVLDESVMSRFMAGRSGLALPTLDRLAEVLGLRVTVTKRTRRTKR
ncbi:MAG: hypothetical protein IT454_21090 [Planctomycetes bacterium]|nr:hypothetical protein [Planctomycetota bacterium]